MERPKVVWLVAVHEFPLKKNGLRQFNANPSRNNDFAQQIEGFFR